jgi:HSP20 family protein
MTISEKAKGKVDEASKEIKEVIDNLKQEVAELTNKVKEKLKGAGEEMHESARELTQEVKGLSEKVKELIPQKRKKGQLPVHVDPYPEFQPDAWEKPFLELRKLTDRLFDDFVRRYRLPMAERRSTRGLTTDIFASDWPAVEMNETDADIRITAELPGVDKDNIDVSVTDDQVIIRGEKKEQEERKGRGYYKSERFYGSFQRSISLPCEVESDRVDAFFKDGVLTVILPKSPAARERIKKISVRTP